jgi:hypothetical protein
MRQVLADILLSGKTRRKVIVVATQQSNSEILE